MEKTLISYVVTAYNTEKFIKQSIQCAFAQTYSPLEIILSDDGSTDNTYIIMSQMTEKYKGPHRVILNQNSANLGITAHMNKAYIELAQGELIVAAHGDDVSHPERTERSWKFLSEHKDFTAVSFSMDAINENGTGIKQYSAIVDYPHFYDFHSGGNIPAPSRCFYRKVMTQFGSINQDCPTEDEIISFRALLLGKNAFLPDHMVQYRKHNGSASNPENFKRFPLEPILKQQDDDMRKAVDKGLLTEQQRFNKYVELYNNMLVRQKYREYFASRSVEKLMRLISFNLVPPRRKLSYCKEHLLYLLGTIVK